MVGDMPRVWYLYEREPTVKTNWNINNKTINQK
jgi:hypothetical protein